MSAINETTRLYRQQWTAQNREKVREMNRRYHAKRRQMRGLAPLEQEELAARTFEEVADALAKRDLLGNGRKLTAARVRQICREAEQKIAIGLRQLSVQTWCSRVAKD